ncbi:MAG: hypothetical protein AAGI69_18955 [Cyanobacteria bacterium P01_H01_bin.21]
MKMNLRTQSVSLLSLLLLVGVTAPIQAESNSATSSAQCNTLFNLDVDEFDGIELTPQQENDMAALEEALDNQFEQILTPEQLRGIEAAEQRFDTDWEAILTPEQQAVAEENGPDAIVLTPEQQEQLAALEDDFWNDAEFISLTEDQSARFAAYEQDYENKLADILTSQQQEQFSRNQFLLDFPEFANLQLTSEQRQQIEQFTEQFHRQEDLIVPEMNPEQTAQLEQLEQSYEKKAFEILTPQQQQAWQSDDAIEANLTAEQEAQLNALDQEFEEAFQAVMPDMNDDQISRLEQLEQQYETQLSGVLNPQQQQQLEANIREFEQLEESCF